MSAADKIAQARALIEPLTGHTPGPWHPKRNEHYWEIRSPDAMQVGDLCASEHLYANGEPLPKELSQKFAAANACLVAAAPALRDTVAALADLADAQAQENERLRETVTVDVKPLEWRDLTYGMNPHWTANHPFGSIDIRQEDEDLEWRWVVRPFIGGRSNWPTLEEAKADAEADYRARVRAALGDAP